MQVYLRWQPKKPIAGASVLHGYPKTFVQFDWGFFILKKKKKKKTPHFSGFFFWKKPFFFLWLLGVAFLA